MNRTHGAVVASCLLVGLLTACSGSSAGSNVVPTDPPTSAARKTNPDGSLFTGSGYIEGLPISGGGPALLGTPTAVAQLSVGDCFSDVVQIEAAGDTETFAGVTNCDDSGTKYWVTGLITSGTEDLTPVDTDTRKALERCDAEAFSLPAGAPGAASTVLRPTNAGSHEHVGPIICLASDGTVPWTTEY